MDFEEWIETDSYEACICKRYFDTSNKTPDNISNVFEMVYKEGYRQGIIEAKNLVVEYISDN